jgi:nucleotide-binding universal stress UspA family protein
MYRHIMVPLDGSELAECVIPHLEAVAGACSDARVTLVYVEEPLHVHGGLESMFSPEERERLEESSMESHGDYLGEAAGRLNCGKATVETKVLQGHVAEELANYASSNGVDLVVMSTHGRSGVTRWVMGSVADKLLHSSRVPVLMVRAPGTAA